MNFTHCLCELEATQMRRNDPLFLSLAIQVLVVWFAGFFFKLSQALLGRSPVCVIGVSSLSLDIKYD